MVNYKTINSSHCTTVTVVIFIMWKGISSRMEPKNVVGEGAMLKIIILEKDNMNKGKNFQKPNYMQQTLIHQKSK